MIMNWIRRLGYKLDNWWFFRLRYIKAKIPVDSAGFWISAEDPRALYLRLTYKGRDVPCYGVLIRNLKEKGFTYLDGITVKKKK